MMKLMTKIAAISIALMAMFNSVYATTVVSNMSVGATIISVCDSVSGTMPFGHYNPLTGSSLDMAGTLSVRCTAGTAYTIALDKGTGSGASIATRKMTSNGNTLTYTIYSDSARTAVWGDTTGSTLSGTGTGLVDSTHVPYGRIMGSQFGTPAGSYADTVIITVNY